MKKSIIVSILFMGLMSFANINVISANNINQEVTDSSEVSKSCTPKCQKQCCKKGEQAKNCKKECKKACCPKSENKATCCKKEVNNDKACCKKGKMNKSAEKVDKNE